MTRDIWWDSDECTENGLVDAIWDSNGTSLRVNRLFSNSAFETTATNTIGDRSENKSKKRKL